MGFKQGHALLIGVGTHKYAPSADVPETVADANAIAAVLRDSKACGYLPEQVKVIHDDETMKAGILAALDDLAQRAGVDDTVFFFYCGHGAPGTDGNYYLVSHDAQFQGGRVMAGTGVSEGELLDKLRTIKAQRVFMVFNACFSGNISPSLGVDEPTLETSSLSEETAAALLSTGSGRIIITACRETQRSYIGNGPLTIFTQALVDGLRGKGVENKGGVISAFSLYESIFETVSDTVNNLYQIAQEPELTVLKGIGPFAVSLYRGATTLGTFDDKQPVPTGPAVHEVKPEKSLRIFNQRVVQTGGVNFGQGNQIKIDGDIFGGDKVMGPQIDARRSQGFIYGAQGPIEQHLGTEVDTGGGAYVHGNVNTGGGDFVGRDKTVHGDEVHGDKVDGDKISVGNISGSSGVAIGRGAQSTVTSGISGGRFQAREIIILQGGNLPERFESAIGRENETTSMTKEPIRLDVAYPQTAVVNETFDIAVAIRQPTAPKLALEDLINVISTEGAVYRSSAVDVVKYRVEVNTADCEIQPAKYTFYLKSGENSPPYFFHITPKREGLISILVNAYQDDDSLAAHTRVLVLARMLVVSPAEFVRLIKELRAQLAAVKLDDDERAAVQQYLASVETQLMKPEPKLMLIRRGLNNIKDVIDAATGVGAARLALSGLVQRAIDMAQQLFK